jgi:hypothetical protein
MIPIEDLGAITASVEEQEEVSRERILAEEFADQPQEPIEALAHVGGLGTQEDANGRRELGEHQ